MIKEFSSFRDPDGFVYRQNDEIYRCVAPSYKENYDLLINSGLYDELVKKKHLVAANEVAPVAEGAYKLLQVQKIDFISYPYEWCFSQYQDAALLTLKIEKQAILHNMSLKDASAYNIQFSDGKPIFIDTLSFEKLDEKSPWIAYKQFCQHFLAPLCLMSYKDVRLSSLMKQYIDGIPLDLAAKLLPVLIRPGIWMNINLHAYFQNKYSDTKANPAQWQTMTKTKQIALIEGLYDLIAGLKKPVSHTEWENYYEDTNYTQTAFNAKISIIEEYMGSLKNVKKIADFGANNGYFTRIALKDIKDAKAVAFDVDPQAVEKNYNFVKQNNETNLLPLVVDLLNPSSGIGWANGERDSISNRINADVVLALALIHHLCITSNIPFDYIASYFSALAPNLIIEFVPKEDTQVQKLLNSRKDIYSWYNKNNFEESFGHYYTIEKRRDIPESKRVLYLLKRK